MPDRAALTTTEPSKLLGPAFSGATLDRAATLRRDPTWVTAQLGAPTSRVVAASAEGVLVDREREQLARAPVPEQAHHGGEPVMLGLDAGGALFALDLEPLQPGTAAALMPDSMIVSLRDAGAILPRSEGGLAAYLTAILNWHRRHTHCANCGAATELVEAGYSRHCPRCGADHFPRTDPVVIMLVEHEARALLGRRPVWPAGRYSVLAGFVSPGESAEEAVVREVQEESGIVAYEPTFVTSQPWPFPSSLMLGFEARSDGGQPLMRDGELEDVRWFTRDALRVAALGDRADLKLPPPVSIARFLIERWLSRADGAR